MNAQQYFEDRCINLFPDDPMRDGRYINEENFINFDEIKERYTTHRLTELKDEMISLLEPLIANEWNISGAGITRMKAFVSRLKSST